MNPTLSTRRRAALAWIFTLTSLGGCDSASRSAAAEAPAAFPLARLGSSSPGAVLDHPDAGALDSQRFFVDPNAGGRAVEFRIAGLDWGRKVDVYGLDALGRRIFQQRDFVIGATVVSDGVDYELEERTLAGDARLVILRDVTDVSSGGGLEQFIELLRSAGNSLAPIATQGPGGAFFSSIPRNATVVVRFDDLLDADLIRQENLRLAAGDPALDPFEYRPLADRNHGALAVLPGESQRRFFTTRVLLDLTASELESLGAALPINELGLPPARSASVGNVLLRIPTLENAAQGQNTVLRNPTGGSVASTGNGPVDLGSPTVDVLRAARSGGPTELTGDAFEGFLPDGCAPRVVGTQAIAIAQRPRPDPNGNPFDFRLRQIRFDSEPCAQAPERGDLIAVPGFLAEVRSGASLGNGGQVFGLRIRLLTGDPVVFQQVAIGPARFRSRFDPLSDAGRAGCFVAIQPIPGGYPQFPTSQVQPGSTFTVAFDEPLDARRFEPHETLELTRAEEPGEGRDWVVGDIAPSLTLAEFTFVPTLPLAHVNGSTEGIWLALGEGLHAPRDLVGNALVDSLPRVAHRIAAAAPTALGGGRVTRFSAPDEEPPLGDGQTGPLPEWSGQFTYDLAQGRIRPRPVTRFQALADRTQALPTLMIPFTTGSQTPLSALGAKLQASWRYLDVGFTLSDPAHLNLDVEGLHWSPVAGQVSGDHFAEFEIRLGHGQSLQDERIDALTLFPKYPHSGTSASYSSNVLAGTTAAVVHARQRGYQVDPGDLFLASSGTPLMPFPLNRGLPPEQSSTYTWRDTELLGRAALGGDGADPEQVLAAGLVREQLYSAGEVQTAGLPLLMEFRCYPDAGAFGLNALDVSLAVNSSARPFFRAFSAGGIGLGGQVHLVDPDLETQANGGFDPVTGAPTLGTDATYYIGAVDFVVRVSRAVSLWFSTEGPTGASIPSPRFVQASIYPPPASQPVGTSVRIDYRGASTIVGNPDVKESALTLDAYGDHYPSMMRHDSALANQGVVFERDAAWSVSASEIDGARYYQLRVTLRSDIASGLAPQVSSIGQAWSE